MAYRPEPDGPPAGPDTDLDRELAAEQAYVDAAYARLEAMRRSAARVAETYSEVRRGGTHQARLERDVALTTTARRLAALDIGDAPLCFGRLDLREGTTYYVGRLAVDDEQHTPIVVDWRAPVAESFYRSTAIEPMGVVRRRHFITRGRELVGLDDEVFDAGASSGSGFTVVGEGALLAALDRYRTGRMGDIVATIQAEQDEAIRADLAGVLVVSGGPGTGKTAVALHRAAYLLYTHRRRLESAGVLLIGPNSVFLRYIDQVLPSLGEDDVHLSTLRALRQSTPVRATEPDVLARLKGDARMAKVIAKAINDRERPVPRDLVLSIEGITVRLRRRDSASIVERVRRRRGTHNAKRPRLRRLVVEHLVEQYGRAVRRERERYRLALESTGPIEPADAGAAVIGAEPDVVELADRLRRRPEVREAIERMWPVLSGAELVHDLFSFPALIRSASDGVLGEDEEAMLARPRSTSVHVVPWTEDDLPLLDEADAVLGPPDAARRRRTGRNARLDADAARVVSDLGVGGAVSAETVLERYGGGGAREAEPPTEPRTYGHILVDEAQDLSPMQWRMLARRCPARSLTVVGDFGQASRPGAPRDWDAVLAALGDPPNARRVTLSVNYRTPAEIMEVARRVLAAASPEVDASEAVRRTGEPPAFTEVAAGEVVGAAALAARRAAGRGGTVAVIAPPPLHDALVAALRDLHAAADTPDALDAPVGVYEAADAKGLEFDHVVVVEPAALVEPGAAGLRLLYVTLTRATRTLAVVHANPLPEPLVPVQ